MIDFSSIAGYSTFLTLVRSWGGDIIVVDDDDLDQFQQAPFGDMGVDWQKKLIVLERKNELTHSILRRLLGCMIHEAGHIFASDVIPDDSDEFNFLGWEWAVARNCNLLDEWEESMQNYSVGSGDDYGALSVDERSDIIEERLFHAHSLNLITVDDQPLTIR